MATSKNDPRIISAINTAMNWERSQVGKATARIDTLETLEN